MARRNSHAKALLRSNRQEERAIVALNHQFRRCAFPCALLALLALPEPSVYAQSGGPLVKAASPLRLPTASSPQGRDSVSDQDSDQPRHEERRPADGTQILSKPPSAGNAPSLLEKVLAKTKRMPLRDLFGSGNSQEDPVSREARPVPSTASADRTVSPRVPFGLRVPLLSRPRTETPTVADAPEAAEMPHAAEPVTSRITDVKRVPAEPVEVRVTSTTPSEGKTHAQPLGNAGKNSNPIERKARFVRREVDRLQRLASSDQRQLASQSALHQASSSDRRGALISFLRNATYSEEQWPAVASVVRLTPLVVAQTPDDTASTIAEEPEGSEPMEPTVVRAEEPRLDESAEEPTDASTDEGDAPKTDQADEVDEPSQTADLNEDGLKSIRELTLDIRPEQGELPRDLAAAKFQHSGEVRHLPGTNRPWPLYEFWWEAPAVCHRPLYFEEVNLERYGYSYGLDQFLLSGAHFFGKVPALPYLITAEPHRDCVYTLGHYPPGSYAPYHIHYPPVSLRAAAVEAAVVSGLIFAIP